MRVGTLAFNRPVMTSTEGRCVASTRWMPTARAICAIRVMASSTLARSRHHQVGELVDDDHDVGQRLLVDVLEEVVGAVFEELVELVDVADVVGGEELEAALHFLHRIAQARWRRAWPR